MDFFGIVDCFCWLCDLGDCCVIVGVWDWYDFCFGWVGCGVDDCVYVVC